MLETTLETKFVPGTNLRGDVACADWRFLLPSLQFDTVLCIGSPPPNTVEVLSRSGSAVYVVLEARRQREKTPGRGNSPSNNCIRIHVSGFSELPFPDQSMDLIYVADVKAGNAIFRNEEAAAALSRLLRPHGTVYFEIHGVSARYTCGPGLKVLARQGFDATEHFWLSPLTGDLRTALPLTNRNITNYFFENVLYGRSEKTKALSWLASGLSKLGLVRYIAPRRGILVHRSFTHSRPGSPPEYLRSLGERTGIEVSHFSCGTSARGKYNTNKVIFFLFEESAELPSAVIKMTRAEEHNFRLENEYRILKALDDNEFMQPTRYPGPLFFGYHNNLAVSCLKAVHGAPFRARTKATADCPIARDAMECILQLGTSSVDKGRASSIEVSKALRDLYERFKGIYTLSKRDDEFLVDQIGFDGQVQKDFPLVFQHGDPGTWNLFVSPEDKVIVIDWEAGERQGMPLWDLFYFFRTYASWMSRTRGTRDALKSFKQHFLESSEMATLLQDITRRYCDAVGLNKGMVGPLFYACWMHRALKEATRLPAVALDSGHYVNLLRLVIESRRNASLTKLFSL